MQQKMLVLGARRFNDSVDGKTYNFTKLRIAYPVPRNSENECGVACPPNDALFGKADSYDELIKRFKFPCECLLDLEVTSKGVDVFDIQPFEVLKPAKG